MSTEADGFFGLYGTFTIPLLRLKARLSYYTSQFARAEEEHRKTTRRLQTLHHLQLLNCMDWSWYYQQCIHEMALAQHAQGNDVSAVASIKSGFHRVQRAFKSSYKSPALLNFLKELLRQLGNSLR